VLKSGVKKNSSSSTIIPKLEPWVHDALTGGFMAAIKVVSEKCCGCRICEMVCSEKHWGVYAPRRGLLRVDINRLPKIGAPLSEIDSPIVCRQCDPSPCANACPENAIEKSTTMDAWVVDEEKCTGCGICINACPFGMIYLESQEGIARKCNLCDGNPSCVAYCPTGALVF
jgi:carbon-monoxide dehydrogenase iron sulfur subunit